MSPRVLYDAFCYLDTFSPFLSQVMQDADMSPNLPQGNGTSIQEAEEEAVSGKPLALAGSSLNKAHQVAHVPQGGPGRSGEGSDRAGGKSLRGDV